MNKARVLIVDDETLVLKAISRELRELHYELVLVDNSKDAIENINNNQFDVIVVDYHMPFQSGLDVLMVSKNTQPNAIRVLMTGDGDLNIVVNAINEGNIFKYISKPWQGNQLVNVISEAVSKKQLIDEKSEIVTSILQEKTEWLEITKRLEHRMVKVNEQGVQALMKVIQAKDMELYNHSIKVAYVVDVIAESLKYSEAERKYLKLAALFHDIGKIAIKDSILYKNGKLDDLERQQMNHHANVSAEILKELDFMQDVAEVVRQHHERYDGSGYPQGLRGNNILQASQVLSLADVYVALREKRPYKIEKTNTESLKIISSESGKAFDPKLVEIVEQALENFIFPAEQILSANLYNILK